jgi:hypothetical protein
MPKSFIFALLLVALAFMCVGVDALMWWRISPSNPIDLGSIHTLAFLGTPYGISVSYNNLNVGTIHPAMLGTAPALVAAIIFTFNEWDRRRRKRGFPVESAKDE